MLLLSDVSPFGNLKRDHYPYEHILSYKQTKRFTPWFTSFRLSPAVPDVWGFILSECWSFVITDMICFCSDISGSSDSKGRIKGVGCWGGVCPARAAEWETSERQEAQIKLSVSESRMLLECVSNTAAPWGIRRPSGGSNSLQREQLTDPVFKVAQLSLRDPACMHAGVSSASCKINEETLAHCERMISLTGRKKFVRRVYVTRHNKGGIIYEILVKFQGRKDVWIGICCSFILLLH